MSDGNDSFIGATFTTPKNGVLTVQGLLQKKGLIYKIVCSLCNKDEDLFPDGFKSSKSNLIKGQIPCGCSKSVRWSEDQYKIIVNRLCTERNYTFIGWSGNFKGKNTKLLLRCWTDDNIWDSTTIDKLKSGRGCTVCKSNKISEVCTVSDSDFTSSCLKTGVFLKGTTFTRDKSSGLRSHWNMYCPSCSNDNYVAKGLCSGIFSCYSGNLLKGVRPCRCSKTYRWSEKQRELDLTIALKGKGVFTGWETVQGYTGNKSLFTWVCKNNHECTSSVSNVLHNGTGCLECSESCRSLGKYASRINDKDFLYLLMFKNEVEVFIKCGRSFNITNRIKSFPSTYDIRLLGSVSDIHDNIYDTEQKLHGLLDNFHITPQIKFGGSVNECFDVKCLENISIKSLFNV